MTTSIWPYLALLQEGEGIEWTREFMFMMCAAIGGAVLILQLVLLFIGFGGVDDIDGMDGGEFDGTDGAFGFLSVRAVAGFLTFFGLAGWGTTSGGWNVPLSLLAAFGSGALAMGFVVYILSLQRKLYSEGNIKPENAVGQTARVYLRIPARAQGKGKITVSIQGRSEQFEATSTADQDTEIPTGAEVRVARMITPGSFEVEPV